MRHLRHCCELPLVGGPGQEPARVGPEHGAGRQAAGGTSVGHEDAAAGAGHAGLPRNERGGGALPGLNSVPILLSWSLVWLYISKKSKC